MTPITEVIIAIVMMTSFGARPNITLPVDTPHIESRVGALETSVTRLPIKGDATWFCKMGKSPCPYFQKDRPGIKDMYAGAGSELQVGKWKGRTVHVCSRGKCIDVKLVTGCKCVGSRIIDLYWDAFVALTGDAGIGVRTVKVSW